MEQFYKIYTLSIIFRFIFSIFIGNFDSGIKFLVKFMPHLRNKLAWSNKIAFCLLRQHQYFFLKLTSVYFILVIRFIFSIFLGSFYPKIFESCLNDSYEIKWHGQIHFLIFQKLKWPMKCFFFEKLTPWPNVIKLFTTISYDFS
jgi:hypothetical protein